jgi:acyl transferase domain-containing protein
VGEGDLAVVGVACRYPGDINDLGALWAALSGRRDATSEAPLSRWDTDAILAHMEGVDHGALDRMRYGGFLSDEVLESFSAEQFGISDAEAAHMDPEDMPIVKSASIPSL